MSSRSQTKLQTVKKALDLCDGSVKEARDLYTTLSDCAQKLDETVKEKLLSKTKYTTSIYLLDREDQKLGGALFKALEKLQDSKKFNLSDVWPKYHYLIEVSKHEQSSRDKSRSTSAGVVSSGDLHSSSTSTSQSLCLSTENIHIVLIQSRKKYQKNFLEKVDKELEQLETYVRTFSNREEMVFISQEQQNEWYKQCLHATKDMLESETCSKRPLCYLLQDSRHNNYPNSTRALYEYCSLLRLEMLFNGMENPKVEIRQWKGDKTPVVHVPSVHMNMKDVIKNMEKYFSHDLYENALEEFRKLQDIEEKIAQDKNLKEGIKGSELALKEYRSMLHSEVLYESKDNLTQVIRHKADLEPCWNISNQATLSSDVYQGIEGSVLESKEFALQEQIDRLQEQMKIRDSEIEGLKARLSQVESMLYNYPEKADLSDINRQTKERERLEKDAHGLL